MPGQKSLQAGQYYAHPQNLFWRLMGELFDAGPEYPYAERSLRLQHQGVAVWDVLKACMRAGSLDSAIDADSIQVNDFTTFFARYPGIRRVYFNGKTAETLFRKQVSPALAPEFSYLELHALPSTSPANASIPLAQKQERWSQLRDHPSGL